MSRESNRTIRSRHHKFDELGRLTRLERRKTGADSTWLVCSRRVPIIVLEPSVKVGIMRPVEVVNRSRVRCCRLESLLPRTTAVFAFAGGRTGHDR
jgi:hypothetical protein